MPLLLPVSPSFAYKRNKNLWEIIQDSGQTADCKLCLDAADSASFDGTGQTWYDLSGNGFDWYRGTNNTSEGSDPTFNGTADGLSSNEYFSFDGGDYFSAAVADPSWINNIHKVNAIWTFLVAFYSPSNPANNRTVFASSGAVNASDIGFGVVLSSGGNVTLQVRGATGSVVGSVAAGTYENGWNVCAMSYDEAAGNVKRISNINYADLANARYTSPSSSNHTDVLSIGCGGDRTQTTTYFESGRYLSAMAMWEGRQLTLNDMDKVVSRLRGRYGL